MEDDALNIRLKLFLDRTGLSNSQFADKCEIPRPTFSQLLSGRNKKVSDILLGQIHKGFPELSMVWLMFGEGEMLSAPFSTSGTAADALSADDASTATPTLPSSGSGDDFSNSSLFDSFGDIDAPLSSFGSANQSTDFVKNPSDFPYNGSAASKYGKENARISQNHAPQSVENEIDYKRKLAEILAKNEELLRKKPRKVVRITVFYDDNSYESFLPSD